MYILKPTMAVAARFGLQRYPNGTPLPPVVSRLRTSSFSTPLLSIVSYNVLAPVYVRPYDKRTGGIQPFAAFEHVSHANSHEVLSIEKRGPKLLDVLLKCGADAICLQELQLEHDRHDEGEHGDGSPAEFVLPEWIRPLVKQYGGFYTTFLPPQEELRLIAKRNVKVLDVEAAVTCAILYRTDRLVPATLPAEDRSGGKGSKRDEDTNTSLSLHLRGAPGSDLEELDPLVLTSLHLDATDEVKRVGQIARVFRRARVLANRKAHDSLPPVIVAGDMNVEFWRGSCVEAYLQSGVKCDGDKTPTEDDFKKACASALFLPFGKEPTKDQLDNWKELYSSAKNTAYDNCIRLARVDTGPTHAALDREGRSASEEPCMRTWCLDHILHTSDRFCPVALWSTLEDDPETSQRIGLPNKTSPSDHMPLGAVLSALPSPVLSEEDRDVLLVRISQLCEQQSRQQQDLKLELDQQLSDIKARYPELDFSTSSRSKKHQKPPQEVMDFMRQKRIRLREVKTQQRQARQMLMDALSDRERLEVQNHFGCTGREWVERGQI